MYNYGKKYIYSITISPPHRKGRLTYQYSSDVYHIRKYIGFCSNHYVFYPELDDSGRLHWHGIFIMTSFRHWAKVTKIHIEDIGFCKIKRLKTFQDHLRYLVYCQKHYHSIRLVLPRIIYKKFNKLKRSYATSPLDYK